ncbi:hypothetical protein BAE44_0001486 [Dichanthelium oligosanthes]|uniref:Rx N-terminal domain-containing protein n=1 Tax=Dichanthelium oligosanthes TaxID=888268 RepID=A0A1E5WJF2_9POAL|nr:hypothetical protein BAE44_0001486 [Dichanthelium oligosanthes]
MKVCEQRSMAESLLLPVLRGVAGKAADVLVQSVARMSGIDDDRRKLERHLVYVQSLLADAEAKSETNNDGFRYEALRREAPSGESMASKVPRCFTSKDRFVFRYTASRDLKNVLEKINKLVAEMSTIGLVERAEAPQVLSSRQTQDLWQRRRHGGSGAPVARPARSAGCAGAVSHRNGWFGQDDAGKDGVQ